MTPATLVSIGGLVLSAIALIGLPLWFRRQSARQAREQQRLADIKEQAQRDAAVAAGEHVSWEAINRALRTSAQEVAVEHRAQIVELRASFADELDRLKRLNDHELDRARKRIDELAAELAVVTRRLAVQVGAGEPDH